ncbi:hypothetical protein OKW46_004467 [Paraburkholderia sp. WSM4179]|nr:hypothetical protein [Paraburkholderia sp. WSM4179]
MSDVRRVIGGAVASLHLLMVRAAVIVREVMPWA